MLKPITSSGASRLWLCTPQLWHDFIRSSSSCLGLPWSCVCWRLCGAWRLSKHGKLAKRCVQHVVATCCRCRDVANLVAAPLMLFSFWSLLLPGYAYRHLMWCHPRPFRDNEPCRAHGHPWAQTVRRWTTDGRTDRRQSTPNGIPNRGLVAPSRRRRCRDSISSTWRRNFCNKKTKSTTNGNCR